MASKRRIRRQSCGAKRRYTDIHQARRVILQLVRDGKSRGGWLAAYSCRWCGGFHFGHTGDPR